MSAPTAAIPGWELDVSPFHAGELAVQRHAGVADAAAAVGLRGIRRFMPDQHRTFFAQLPLFVLGGVDADGQPWATLRVGAPGFVHSPDARTLRIAGDTLPGDPLEGTWRPGAPLGGLGIEFDTRRRNRVNGVVQAVDGNALTIAVEQSFGNCAKYIQGRKPTFEPCAAGGPFAIERSASLSDADRALLSRADTFFVASANTSAEAGAAHGVDVSHRGGMPGFVRVDDDATLTTPDFSGNRLFNTLGNLHHDPRAGLLFIDFERGDLLYVAALAEIVWDGPRVASFDGAQRVVRYRVQEVRRSPAALPLRWSPVEWAPQFAARMGQGDAASSQAPVSTASGSAWRPLRVTGIVDEAQAIRSLYFEAADGGVLPPYEAGQHMPIRVAIPGRDAPAMRSYTLSAAPDGRRYRITVKREGAVSAWLHDHARIGATVDAQAPRGLFTFDTASPRPAVLISAGIGITPMIAMLGQALAGDHPARRVYFVHGARTPADRPFAAELMCRAAADARLSLHWFDSRAGEGDGGPAQPGRIDVAQLKRILPFDDYDFYLCGPSAFMRDLYEGLRALNVADERIRFEAFGPSSVTRKATVVAGLPTGEVKTVAFRRAGREAAWAPGGGTLLELAEAHGIAAPFECRSGACGTCATRVLSGQVEYTQAPDAPVEPGCALLCVAHPAGGVEGPLVLDL
ncbi:2Fe-2S iron-sulfur cluster binding domain-containing protein [Burkholderia sp. 4701]|nr:2Fe-2S iron-sulfur cluster binding domain-containing protein [Burkholderia sp. 4701]MXN86564.1 2Fe-2S iron-sulfur cluster binding domain-containing protein [Burkholderia sp. 4812]